MVGERNVWVRGGIGTGDGAGVGEGMPAGDGEAIWAGDGWAPVGPGPLVGEDEATAADGVGDPVTVGAAAQAPAMTATTAMWRAL